MSRRLFALILATPPLLAALVFVIERSRHALDVPPRLPDDARVVITGVLRRALEGESVEPAAHPALGRRLDRRGPLVASVWLRGERVIRVEGRGDTIAAALSDAATRLGVAASSIPDAREGRIQVDLVVARGPLATRPPRSLLPLDPGRDGVGMRLAGGGEVLLGADEIAHGSLLGADTPMPGAPELKTGLDLPAVEALLARRAALPAGGWAPAKRGFFRFRAESFVEPPSPSVGQVPLAIERTLVPGPPVTRETLLAAARAGGDYLSAHLAPNGRYVYEVDLATGVATDPRRRGAYSLPRHAGTTYYLAELHEVTRDPALRETLVRALDHLADLARGSGCRGTFDDGTRYACVIDKGSRTAYMGSTALAAVAFAEYRLTTGDGRYDALLRDLLEWIVHLERDDGGFTHSWNVKTRERSPARMLYFDGEAALALARGAKVFGEARYVAAAERALDQLVAWTDRFAGKFFFGEDHWTCIAAEAAWPELKHDRYREFCSDYAAFLRRQQFDASDPGDFDGAYGVTPFLVPHNTPVGSRTEAMISAYQLGRHHGRPEEAIRRQVLAAVHALLRQQIRPESEYWVKAKDARGAMPGSTVDPVVRIDYVQHTGSAILRAVDLVR